MKHVTFSSLPIGRQFKEIGGLRPSWYVKVAPSSYVGRDNRPHAYNAYMAGYDEATAPKLNMLGETMVEIEEG